MMKQTAKELVQQSNIDMAVLVPKSGVGLFGSFAAMTINDLAGLLVAILTGVYMTLQIESAWRKRKQALSQGDKNVLPKKKDR
jgi:prefoldin subunit 5